MVITHGHLPVRVNPWNVGLGSAVKTRALPVRPARAYELLACLGGSAVNTRTLTVRRARACDRIGVFAVQPSIRASVWIPPQCGQNDVNFWISASGGASGNRTAAITLGGSKHSLAPHLSHGVISQLSRSRR